jgi:hypothetical protein
MVIGGWRRLLQVTLSREFDTGDSAMAVDATRRLVGCCCSNRSDKRRRSRRRKWHNRRRRGGHASIPAVDHG